MERPRRAPRWDSPDLVRHAAGESLLSRFGRRLRLYPVATETDGAPYTFVHADWRSFWPAFWGGTTRPHRMELLTENLRRQRIRHALVMRASGEEWTPHYSLLRSDKRAAIVRTGEDFALFRITD
jgi:hypothetical protein